MLLHLIPNPAIDGLDCEALAGYVRQVAAEYALPLRVETFLAHVPARKVIPCFFAAGRCHPETPETAAAVSVAGATPTQSGYSLFPIWILCDKFARLAPGIDARHQLFTRAIWHELGHTLGGLRDSDHSPNRRDVMHGELLPGPWFIDQRLVSRFRLYLRG